MGLIGNFRIYLSLSGQINEMVREHVYDELVRPIDENYIDEAYHEIMIQIYDTIEKTL